MRVPPDKTTIDVLAVLNQENAWPQDRDPITRIANGAEDVEEYTRANMDEIIGNRQYPHKLKAVIIGLGRTANDSQLRLIAASGKLMPVTAVHVPHELVNGCQLGEKVIALHVISGEDEVFFPLYKKLLLHAEIKSSEHSDPSTIIRLLRAEAKKADILQCSDNLSPNEQLGKMIKIRENIEKYLVTLGELFGDRRYLFEVRSYRTAPYGAAELGWENSVISEGAQIEVDDVKLYDPEIEGYITDKKHGEDLYLALEVDLTQMRYLVPIQDIVDCHPVSISD